MKEKERNLPKHPGQPDDPDDGNLAEQKAEIDKLFASADQAVDDALSHHDATAFLAAHQQQGGQ